MLKEDLIAARNLIKNKSDWGPHAYARGKHSGGIRSPLGADEPLRYCAVGALLAITGVHQSDRKTEGLNVLNRAASALYPEHPGILEVNDQIGHEAVLATYDLAIERAKWKL